MKQMTRVYPGLSQGFATILCALTAAPPGGYFMCCTVFTDLSESILTNSIVFQSGSVLCFQLQFISTHDQIVCVYIYNPLTVHMKFSTHPLSLF